jgi:hypothetical protein
MANEEGGQPPTGNPNQQSLTPSPGTPLPQESVVPNDRTSNAKQNNDNAKQMANEIHWVHRATFWSQIGLGIIGLGALCIYHGQLTAMQGQLKQMKSSSEQTDRQICLYQQQVAQMQRQVISEAEIAEASVDQAEIVAKSERPRIEFRAGAPVVKSGQPIGVLGFDAQNVGKTSAFNFRFDTSAIWLPEHAKPVFSYASKYHGACPARS